MGVTCVANELNKKHSFVMQTIPWFVSNCCALVILYMATTKEQEPSFKVTLCLVIVPTCTMSKLILAGTM